MEIDAKEIRERTTKDEIGILGEKKGNKEGKRYSESRNHGKL